jgi:hypothetical protein
MSINHIQPVSPACTFIVFILQENFSIRAAEELFTGINLLIA